MSSHATYISSSDDRVLSIGLVAGEASGDILGAGLIQALKQAYPNAVFEGIGGPKMVAQGMHTLFPQDRLAVMGLVEPLKRLPELLGIRRTLKRHFCAHRPDVFIGIDSPDFNLGLEKSLRKAGIRTVHYVSPSVWAWRQGRIKTIAKAADLVLTLFPFEKQFYDAHQVRAECVGHPLADQIPMVSDKRAAQAALGLAFDQGSYDDVLHEKVLHEKASHLNPSLGKSPPVVAVLPGSRASEVERMAPAFLSACELIQKTHSNAIFVLPAANEKRWAELKPLVDKCTARVKLITGRSHEAMCAADAVLIASGTTTLEALLLKRPMVIAYKVAALSYWLFKRLIKVPYIGLPNLLAQKPLVPELIQDNASPCAMAEAILKVLVQPEHQHGLLQEYKQIHTRLKKNANVEAARHIKRMIEGNT